MVARIIEWCATHRAAVFLATAFALFGAVLAIRRVPLDAIPDLGDPQVIVFTEWMGRSPDLVEDQVTYPIVSSLLGAPRVVAVRGQSMFGMSFVYVIFEEGTDLYWARSRVVETMGTMRSRLPEGVTPTLGPDATSVGWVFQYALVDRSGKHDLAELRAFQDFQLRYALASVPGVAEVATVGGYERQYQVEVDPIRLHAYDLSVGDVVGAIRRSNRDVGGRVLEMSGREYYVRGRGYVKSLDDLSRVALGVDARTGTPVRVADVGRVSFGPDIRRGVSEMDGEGEAVGGVVVMRTGENALHVIERVKQRLRELQSTLPPGVHVKVVYDRSALIHHAIGTLRHTLVEEMIVVSLVIFLFLLHLRSTLVPVLSLPVAVALAFIPMMFLRINSNIMSLGGIAIAIGAMVDAAIVLVENAHKHLETAPPGADRQRVIIDAAKEVGPPIFFALLVITVAFVPIFALDGQAGRLFKPLAWTKTFAMAFAALVSVTLAPALMIVFVRGRVRHEHEHPVSRALIAVYRPFAWVALKNPRTTLLIGLAAVLSAVPLGLKLGHEFMPPLNEGDLLYMPTTFPNISIEEAKRYLQLQDRRIKEIPEVERVFGKAGRANTPTDPAPLSMVETVVKLRPRSQWREHSVTRWWSHGAPGWTRPALRVVWPDRRRLTWDELVAELNGRVHLPGWTNAWTMPIKTRVDMLSTGIRTPIGVKVFGADLDTIERIGIDLEHTLARVTDTRSVYSDRNTGGLYLDIVPDRAALARYGLTVGEVQDVIEAAVGGEPIETTVAGRQRFTISVRYPADHRENIDRLKHVLIPLPAGGARGRRRHGRHGRRLERRRPVRARRGGRAAARRRRGDRACCSRARPVRRRRRRHGTPARRARDARARRHARRARAACAAAAWATTAAPAPRPRATTRSRSSAGPGSRAARAAGAGGGHPREHGPADDPRRVRHARGLRVRGHGCEPARHRQLGRRGQARRREAGAPAGGLRTALDRAVRVARGDAEAHEGARAGDAADRGAAAVPELRQPRADVPGAGIGAVRAGGQRVADGAAALQPVHGDVGGADRAGGARHADGRGDGGVLRRRVPALEARGPHPHVRRRGGGDARGLGAARAPQADDGGDHDDRPRAAAVVAGGGRRRDEAPGGADGGRAVHVGVPDARDHPRAVRPLAVVAGETREVRGGRAAPSLP